jgi:hypothetical protein
MFPQCKQILSIYNHEAYCHVHQGSGPQANKPKVVAPVGAGSGTTVL